MTRIWIGGFMRLRDRVSRTIANNYYNDLRQACLAISRNRLIEARTYLVRAHTAAQNKQDQSTLNLLEHAQAIFQELGRLEQQQTQYGEAYLATIKTTSEMKANLYLLFEYPHRTFIQLQQFIHLIWLIVWSVIKSAIRISVTAPPSVSAAHAADTIIIESTAQMAHQTPSPVVVPPVSTANAGKIQLVGQLFGNCRATINDLPIEKCASSRGRALFIYLLMHRATPTPSEVLMDVFWPDASPKSARNSLNVALHNLRQSLRTAIDQPTIMFQNGAYCFSAEIQVWTDVDMFERYIQSGQKLELSGNQQAEALREYEAAIELYQGDFMADDPYEEWAVFTRERLRVTYLDLVNRLSGINFEQHNYSACINQCKLILALDKCREDVHCRLMMCYVRLNQHHLALRQYQACVDALHTELNVAPASTTRQLYERIREREDV